MTATEHVPQYRAGGHAALTRDEAMALMDRLVAHLRNGTTDQAAAPRKIPITSG